MLGRYVTSVSKGGSYPSVVDLVYSTLAGLRDGVILLSPLA